MSETMHIQFAPDMPTAAVEVITPDLEIVKRVALSAGTDVDVEVPSADSFIRVHLPSGRDVTLNHSGDLSYLVTRAAVMPRRAAPTFRYPGTPGIELQPSVKTLSALRSYNDTRSSEFSIAPTFRSAIQVFSGIPELEGGLKVKWIPEVHGWWSEDSTELEFQPSERDAPYELRIEGPRSFRIKIPGNIQAAYIRSDEIGEKNQVVSVRISTASQDADVVGAYLMRADYFAAETMASWAQQAEYMLQAKKVDPYAATVAAYLLLRLKRYDLMHNWPRNLANWFSEIPDGCIIWAAQCALSKRDRKQAKKYVDRGIQRGLPVYTEGVHLLSSLLRKLGSFGEERLRELEVNTRSVVWNSPFTTMATDSPDQDKTISIDIDYASSL